ncbi:MAG: hypothetical protein IJ574_04950 [Bacilli bacterium]|nr:hypothetical protein [Bacilli bacterium]
MSSMSKKGRRKVKKKLNIKNIYEWNNLISKCLLVIYILLITLIIGITIGSVIWAYKSNLSAYKLLEVDFFSNMVNFGSLGMNTNGLIDDFIAMEYLSNQFGVLYYIFSVALFGISLIIYSAVFWYSFIDIKEKPKKINVALKSTIILFILNIILVLIPSIIVHMYYRFTLLIVSVIIISIIINLKYVIDGKNRSKK